MTYSMPLLTDCSYLAAAGTLVVGIECRLPARYTLAINKRRARGQCSIKGQGRLLEVLR